MSDYTVRESERDLHESIEDLNNLLKDYDQSQQALDEERGVLTDQVQGALAEYEKQVHDYEQRRDALNKRQAELSEQRGEAEKNREWLQMQLDARLGRTPEAKEAGKAKQAEQAPSEGIVSKADVEKLDSQLSKPKPEQTLDPPGGKHRSMEIDRDLKRLAEEKRAKLDGASEKLRADWSKSTGRKR